jgi:predicted Fe-S protein YdhL (DUF1289 family)
MTINESSCDDIGRISRPLSPCTLICTLDDEQRCLGCGRSLLQISQWALLSAAEQWVVIDELAARARKNGGTITAVAGD